MAHLKWRGFYNSDTLLESDLVLRTMQVKGVRSLSIEKTSSNNTSTCIIAMVFRTNISEIPSIIFKDECIKL